MILSEALFPPVSGWLGPGESETKLGAPAARDAVQLNDPPPVLLTVNGCVVVPVVTLMVSEEGVTVSVGVAFTVNEIPTVCELPTMGTPALVAVSEIVAVYDPAVRAAEFTLTLKVAVSPEAIFAGSGVTVSQPVPESRATFGLIVTLPLQVPVALAVNVWTAGFVPACVLKVSSVTGNSCNAHEGCTLNVMETLCSEPMIAAVWLSVAVILIVPV
jgi:hypothetical protein